MPNDAPIPLDPFLFGQEQRCFGCAPKHDHGLRMRFFKEVDSVTTRFMPSEDHQGPPGMLHGGIQSTLADELGAWTIIGLLGKWGFTSSIDIRLLRPVRVGIELEGRGRITLTRETPHGLLVIVSTMFTQEKKTTLRGRVSFLVPTQEDAERILGRPLSPEWRSFAYVRSQP